MQVDDAGTVRSRADAFTLVEVLIGLAIVAMAMTVVWQSFTAAINAWQRGDELIKDLHHGDFVMDQLVQSLRSAAYFDGSGDIYGFRLEKRRDGRYPNDILSWVKSGSGLMPYGSRLAHGLHRVEFTVDRGEAGDDVVMVRVFPHLARDDEDFAEGESWELSPYVQGVEARVYMLEEDEWSDTWDETNAVPSMIELTLYMEPLSGDTDPVKMSRIVQVPVSREQYSGISFSEPGRETSRAAGPEGIVPRDPSRPTRRPDGGGGGADSNRRPQGMDRRAADARTPGAEISVDPRPRRQE